MRSPYQMDLFDLEEKSYKPFSSTPPIRSYKMYQCPKCGSVVGHYEKEGKDIGWHDIKDKCINGHHIDWSGIQIERSSESAQEENLNRCHGCMGASFGDCESCDKWRKEE